MTPRLPATTITSSTYTRRCALNSAPRPPPLRGGYHIFAISQSAAARSGGVRRINTPKSDAHRSSNDATKMSRYGSFFWIFLQRSRGVAGKV
nr:MAG TPA: hypothetical protein [Caudoviricetes sp.]